MKKILSIEGMTCGHCVMHTTESLKAVEGVASVDVELASGTAVVELAVDISDDALKDAVAGAGYKLTAVKAAA